MKSRHWRYRAIPFSANLQRWSVGSIRVLACGVRRPAEHGFPARTAEIARGDAAGTHALPGNILSPHVFLVTRKGARARNNLVEHHERPLPCCSGAVPSAELPRPWGHGRYNEISADRLTSSLRSSVIVEAGPCSRALLQPMEKSSPQGRRSRAGRSQRLMPPSCAWRSIAASSSSENSRLSRAATFSCTCSARLAPIRAEVTR